MIQPSDPAGMIFPFILIMCTGIVALRSLMGLFEHAQCANVEQAHFGVQRL